MSRKFFVNASLLIILGLAGGFAISYFGQPRKSLSGDPAIILEPLEHELPESILEFGEETVSLTLKNGSSGPLTVTSVENNCGCIEPQNADGDPLKFPVKVGPKESMPLFLKISPTGIFGKIRLTVAVNCKNKDGDAFSRAADLIAHISGGLRAFPSSIILPDASPKLRSKP